MIIQKKTVCRAILCFFPFVIARLLLCLLLVMPTLYTGFAQAAEPNGQTGQAGQAIFVGPEAEVTAWKKRVTDLQTSIDATNAASEDIRNSLIGVREQYKGWEKEFNSLITLYQLSRANPQQVDDITVRLTVLGSSLSASSGALKKQSETVTQEQEHIKVLQEKLKEQIQLESLNSSGAEYVAAMKGILKQLGQAEKNMKNLRASLDGQLAPVTELSAQVVATAKEILEQLPSLWRLFYLTHSKALFDPSAYQELPAHLTAWWNGLMEDSQAILQQKNVLLSMALKCFFVFIPFAFILLLAERKRAKSPHPYPSALRRIYRLWLPLLIMAAACYYSSWRGSVDFFLPLALIGHCCWLWGFVALAWEVRLLFINRETSRKSPFIQLLIPCFIGIVLLFLAPPSMFVSLLWLIIMVVNLLYGQKTRRKKRFPPFEQMSIKIAFYVYLVSLIGTVLGWANLCIAGVVLFTAIIVNLQLALGLTKVVATESTENASDLSRQGTLKALVHAIRMALGTPLSWLVACVCLIPWFTVLPGTPYLFRDIIAAKVIVGSLSISFARIFFILFAFYMTHAAIIVGRSFVSGVTMRAMPLERGMVGLLQTALTYMAWGVFGLLTLKALGLNLMSIAVIAGGLSVGLGFGLQTIFNNFISGILLIFGRSLQEGDVIQLGETWGTVKKITVRSTMVETFDNATIFVPNSELISQRLTNWTNNNRTIRKDIAIRIAYGSDLAEVERILMDVASNNKHVLYYPAPRVFLQNFSPTALDVVLRVWLDDLDNMVIAPSEMRFEIERQFAEAGIEIPVVPIGVETVGAGPASATISTP